MPYKILTDIETVFATLRRKTGETLEAHPGDVVELDEADPDVKAALDAHLAADTPLLEHTDEPVTAWPRPVETPPVDEPGQAALAAARDRAVAEQQAADDAAHAQALLDAEAARLAAEQAQSPTDPEPAT
jgi:hypothetical protein